MTNTPPAAQTNRFLIVVILAAIVLAIVIGVAIVSGNSTAPAPQETPVAESLAPDAALSEYREWTGTVALNGIPLEVTLDGENAPIAVASFVSLAESGYFDGTSCHRLTTQGIYVLQCGDPTATGTGGPGYSFGPVENDPADSFYPAGTLAMARVGNDGFSNGSQFFIVYEGSSISTDSAGGYTVFGKITGGLDVVQEIAAEGVAGGGPDGTPAVPAVIGAMTFQ